MKKFLLLLTFCFAAFSMVKAQDEIILTGNLNMELEPGSTYAFYDSGGASGSYGTDQNYTATFTYDGNITINFTSLVTESASNCNDWDYMLVYDGDASTGTLIGRGQTSCTTNALSMGVDYVATSGTLTIVWQSDYSSVAAGWVATITTPEPEGPTCAKPATIEASAITDNGATLIWTEGSGVYNVEYKKASDEEWTSLLSNTSEQTTDLSELASSTVYDIRVQSYCADLDTLSGWRTGSFRTECGIISIAENGTWTEDFESYAGAAYSATSGGELDACWLVAADQSVKPHVIGSGSYYYTHSGTKSLTFYGVGYCYAALPHFADALNGLRISFWAQMESTTSGVLKLGYITAEDPGDFSTFVEVETFANSGTMKQYEYWLNALPADADRLVFQWYWSSSYSYVCDIDDISVALIPTCFKPSDLEVSNIAKTSVDIAWTANTEESAWILEYKKSSESAWQSINDVTENPYTLSGLEAYTAYDVRISAACSAEDISDPSDVISFKTAAGIPFSETFDSSLPSDWKMYSQRLDSIWEDPEAYPLQTITYGWYVGNTNGVFPETPNHLYLEIYGTSRNHWVVTPSIEIEDNVQLTFDMALTKNSGTLQPVTAGSQDDDKFYVLITADGGQTWEELTYWDNVSSADPYDQINSTANGQTVVIDLSGYAGQNVQLAFYGESTVSGGDNNLHIDNVKVDYVPACSKPMGVAVNGISAAAATFTWDEAEDAGEWAFGLVVDTFAVTEFVPASEMFVGLTDEYGVTIDTLSENTPYIFFLRHACEGANSEYVIRRFRTIQTPVTLPFEDDFEGANGWLFFNGELTNAWAIGNATNNGGEKALYISNNGGAANEYNNGSATMVYATKSIEIEEDATYTFKYDWKANGESGWDFLRVVLAPASAEFAAGTSLPSGWTASALPSGFIALDGGSALVGSSAWQTQAVDLEMQAGFYNVVLAWRNDGSGGTNPPAAIDNFSIKQLMCARPENVILATGVDSIGTDFAIIDWNATGSESNWLVQYKKSGAADWTSLAEPVTVHPYTLEGLDASSNYDVRVAAWCDPEDEATISEYSDVFSFPTECEVVATFPYAENFDGLAGATSERVLPACWSYINTTTYSSYAEYPSIIEDELAPTQPNSLMFYSYDYYSYYDAQDQYAILPEIEGISGLRIKLSAAAYVYGTTTYDATFSIGVMTDPADASTFVPVATKCPTTAEFEPYIISFAGYNGVGKYIAIKMEKATTYRSVFIDDIVVEEIPACVEAEGLAIKNVSAESAEFIWAAEENGAWKYAVALASAEEPALEDFVSVDTNYVAIPSLTPESDYIFYLRRDCGSSVSASISLAFRTIKLPMDIPFADDFEGDINWDFVNGTLTNNWVIGSATNNGGEKALYISNDGGTTNKYAHGNTAVYAMAPFNFEGGNYIFKYDWKADGESGYDYLRVALAPASAQLTAGTALISGLTSSAVPEGWVALDGGSQLSKKADWQNVETEEMSIPAGAYFVVFAWTNDGSVGAQDPAAAIDNFSIRKINCLKPSNMEVSGITANSAILSWDAPEGQDAWEMILTADPNFDMETIIPLEISANPYEATELESDTLYYVYMRANCGEDGYSDWSAEFTFRTAKSCQLPANFELDTVTTTMATLSWDAYGQTVFNFKYSADTTQGWIDSLNVTMPFTINDLQPGTKYLFKAQPVCAAEDEWTAVFSFKTVYGVPYLEDFDSYTSMPSEWTVATGLLSDILAGGQLTSGYGWNFISVTTGVFGSKHIYANIYGTDSKKWIIAPNVEITGNTQLTFDMAYTGSSTATTALKPGSQNDDKIAVLISIDGGETWSVLRQWDNAGSAYVLDNISNTGEEVAIDLTEYNGQSVAIAFYGESTSGPSYGDGDNYLHIDNVKIDAIPSCLKPTGLVISDVKDTIASFAWDDVEDIAWEYAILADAAIDSIPADEAFNAIAINSLTVDTLSENTAYVFFLRANCGEENGKSVIIAKAFHTTLHPAALPYADDFENGNNWQLINGTLTNAWVVGEAANATLDGSHALYVSNDGGTTHAYTITSNATVYAAKLFDFAEDGTYKFEYDWMANGEGSSRAWDYLRVALVPVSIELEAGTSEPSNLQSTLPTGWIALDEGALKLSPEWGHKAVSVEVESGLYNVVFAWRNDGSSGEQAPAAVDNISIAIVRDPTAIEGNAAINTKAVKFIRNNHVYILINGTVYNVTGQKVEVK